MKTYADCLADVRSRPKLARGVRLLWAMPDGSENFADLDTHELALARIPVGAADWVIVERTESGPHGRVGKVLASIG